MDVDIDKKSLKIPKE